MSHPPAWPNLSLMGNLLTVKVSRQNLGRALRLIFICCYLRPDA